MPEIGPLPINFVPLFLFNVMRVCLPAANQSTVALHMGTLSTRLSRYVAHCYILLLKYVNLFKKCFDAPLSFTFIFQYQAYSTAVRFLFPNNDTVTLPARSGCSVRDAILPLCEARGLPVQALEIFQSESKEVSLVDQ